MAMGERGYWISGLVITVGGLGATLLAAYSSLDSMKDVIPYHAGATAILEPTTPRISWYKSVRKITERTPKAYPEFAALKPAEKCVERPSRLYNDAKVGFVIGAFNHYASSNRFFGAVSAIESLVKIGGWGGKIYLITTSKRNTKDNTTEVSCFSQSYLRNLTGNPNIYILDTLKKGSSGGGIAKAKMYHIVENFHSNHQASAGPPPDYLIWHDADHLWAKPGCVEQETLKELPKFGPNATIFWYALNFHPETPNRGAGNHVGTFVAHRKWSKFSLDKWAEEILKTPNTQDYNPLHRAWVENQKEFRPSESPDPFKDHMWDHGNVGCHNHMSYFGRCRANGAVKAHRFISSLCLETLGGPETEYLDLVYCGMFGMLREHSQRAREKSDVNCKRFCSVHGNVDGSVK
ncbi:hypothetical protein AAMO2058_000396300 [Amorphochlora amoebiformis]